MKYGIITGASRGIGQAIALKLSQDGYDLLLQGRDKKALENTCNLRKNTANSLLSLTADLFIEDSIDKILGDITRERVDLLVNNAGVAFVKPFEQITGEQWRKTIAVNITAPFLLTQKIIPLMPEGASIVNILSIAARTGFPGWSSYCMSKFALEGMMQSIREELRSRGIRVINVYPGATSTAMWNNIEGQWSPEKMLKPEDIADAVSYALKQPPGVAVENITLGNISGTL